MKKSIIAIFCILTLIVIAGWSCSENDTNSNANVNTEVKNINEGLEYFEWDNENVNTNSEVKTNTNTNQAAAANENVNKAIDNVELSAEEQTAAETRDAERLSDVRTIQTAIEAYKADKGNYPDESSELISGGYLSAWLANPTPGGADYVYTPIGSLPAQYYDLSYELEVGAEGVIEGVHVANPDGIAVP